VCHVSSDNGYVSYRMPSNEPSSRLGTTSSHKPVEIVLFHYTYIN